MRSSCCRLIVLLLLALGGCVVPDEMRTVPISEGRVVDIPMGPHGPRNGKANGYEVMHAWFSPGAKEREIIYQFAISVSPAATLQSVKVEDISDEHAYLLIDDQHPWVTDGHWMIDTLPIKADDPRLAWVYHVTPSLRVYRFTLIDSAGKRTVLYQVVSFPNGFKAAIRHKWGEKD